MIYSYYTNISGTLTLDSLSFSETSVIYRLFLIDWSFLSSILPPKISISQDIRKHSKMDHFQRLAPELRLMILERIPSKRAISQLIQASPAMLGQYMASKELLTRKLLAADFDEEMIQDAMAIILYPSHMYPVIHSSTMIHHLCASWASKRLPNPLQNPAESPNARYIQDLGKLHGRLVLFIEDYLTKATAFFPPREYVCLPALSPMQTHSTFKGKPVSPVFDAARLTGGERSRLLKAFLRHHLMILVSRDGDWYDHSRHCYRQELYQYGGRNFRPFEQEAIFCVREYVESLYGTIFAQLSDSWLPEAAPVPTSTRLCFPDNVFFDPRIYASDIGCRPIDGYPVDVLIAARMAGFGLDLAWAFLRLVTAGQGHDQLRSWFQNVLCEGLNRLLVWMGSADLSPAVDRYGSFWWHQGAPGMYRLLQSRIDPRHRLQHQIYRQRAWPFLDNARFYPSSAWTPHFPASADLARQLCADLAIGRALRRSQTWHDGGRPPTRDEASLMEIARDAEPETESNHSLPDVVDGNARLSQPFWL